MAKVPPAGRAMARFIARTLAGAKAAPFPGFVRFCNPSLKAKVPTGGGWLYEIKFDGYRCQLHLKTGKAKAYSRNGNDFTRDFAPVCAAAERIKAKSLIIDGEVIVPDADGRPDFSALRSAIGKDPDRLLFYAFDLLYLDGLDIRNAPLIDRRSVLAHLVATLRGGRILLSETIDEPGETLMQRACAMNLEGIVAKRADAPYRAGRVDIWQKIKCVQTLPFPIIGYVPARGTSLAALRLGRRDGEQLIYVGKAGTGFTAKSASEVRKRLEPLMRKTPPTAKPLRKKDTVWVEPTVEAEIEFRDITSEGMLRHASFKGLKP
jgi:bifunctional non-homologous end joining protein LigD